MPSLTINCTTNMPSVSRTNAGVGLVASVSTAVLPTGTLVNDHLNVSGSPSTSEDALPSRTAIRPATIVWAAPALATGAEFSVVMVTVSGVLATVPSCTTSCATYMPGRSITKIGRGTVPSSSAAVLPAGTLISAQL